MRAATSLWVLEYQTQSTRSGAAEYVIHQLNMIYLFFSFWSTIIYQYEEFYFHLVIILRKILITMIYRKYRLTPNFAVSCDENTVEQMPLAKLS